MLKAFFPKIEAQPFPDRAALLAALKDGKVEAVFGDGMQLAFWTSGADAAGCCRLFDGPYLSEKFLGEGLTIMLRKEDTALTDAIAVASLFAIITRYADALQFAIPTDAEFDKAADMLLKRGYG